MELIHIGLVSSSESNADRFYGELLELPRIRKSELSAHLANELFGIDQSCDILYYGETPLLFEVFVTGWSEPAGKKISHACIEVPDCDDLLKRCGEIGFSVREAHKGDKLIVFIEDSDGNLFEVKEKC